MVLFIFTLHSSPMEQAPTFVNQEFYHLLSPEAQLSLGNVLLFEHKNDEQWYYQTNTGEKKVKNHPLYQSIRGKKRSRN